MPVYHESRFERPSPDLYFELALSRLLRPLLRKAVSSHRISQGFFAQLSRNCRNSGIHHLNSGHGSISLEQAQREIGSGSVVLVGSSDRDYVAEDLTQLRPDLNFYIQNLCAPMSSNIQLLPIGVEDLSWARAGMPWNFRSHYEKRRKTKFLLVGPFGSTHPDRERLEVLRTSPYAHFPGGRMSSIRYASTASEYMFVACPRGNGRDTHRLWESLYRGSVPVVLDDHFGRNLKSMGLPIVLVKDWSDAPEACLEHVSLAGFKSETIPQLQPTYWSKLFGC